MEETSGKVFPSPSLDGSIVEEFKGADKEPRGVGGSLIVIDPRGVLGVDLFF